MRVDQPNGGHDGEDPFVRVTPESESTPESREVLASRATVEPRRSRAAKFRDKREARKASVSDRRQAGATKSEPRARLP